MQSVVDMLERLAAEPGASLFQETLSRAELLIGNPLLFMPLAASPNSDAQKLAGGFNLLHGGHAMAFVIMVGLLKRGVSLHQQRPGSAWAGENAISEGKDQANKGQAHTGTEYIGSHIIVTLVIKADA